MNIIKKNYIRVINQLYRTFQYPKVHKLMHSYNTCSVPETIDSLIDSNRSLGRFGDGEILWILMKSNISFERNSKSLSHKLLNVLQSNDKNFEVTLPNIFYSDKNYVSKAKRFYRLFMAKDGYKILPYLNQNKRYYNTDISRLYTGYGYNHTVAKQLFNKLKKIWYNKNILIIEGVGTRLGVGNDLFSNTQSIKRIECPISNAFESYNKILKTSLHFLKKNSNKEYLTLIALGPTATVLSYDLYKRGYRAIDIGHVDIEYEWYLMNAKTKINISNRYVNEAINENGLIFKPIKDKIYKNEIVTRIK